MDSVGQERVLPQAVTTELPRRAGLRSKLGLVRCQSGPLDVTRPRNRWLERGATVLRLLVLNR